MYLHYHQPYSVILQLLFHSLLFMFHLLKFSIFLLHPIYSTVRITKVALLGVSKIIEIRISKRCNDTVVQLKWSEVAQLCPTLCDPMDCSLPGSSSHGIFQARVLEWVANSFSRGSSQPRDRTLVSRIVGRHFTVWATREAPLFIVELFK